MSGASLKTRLVVMGAINAAAVVAAGVLIFSYLRLGQFWALPGFVAALAVGFGAQIWFIAGLRGPSEKSGA